ncbi:MAG TPA: hypothetical protein VGP07_18880 [Polyangia bacterium]
MTGARARSALLGVCLGVAWLPRAEASPADARPGARAAAQADKPLPAPAATVAAPAAAVTADAPPPPTRTAAAPDLEKLRAEYDRLREELFKARVRSQKVSETVWPSKMDVHLRWKGSPDFVIRKARMLLDGAELWDSADRPQTDDVIDVSERSVKPGPHAFTVRLEIRPKSEKKGGTKTGADKLGYTSEHTFAIVVPEGGVTHLALTGDEDGDPPEYEPELELEIETDK